MKLGTQATATKVQASKERRSSEQQQVTRQASCKRGERER
jgi:hypothetical protein